MGITASSVPIWSGDDLRLITTGRASILSCSDSDQAKVFMGNKIISTFNRIRAGHLNPSGISKLKLRSKLFLQSRQIFGNSCLFWTSAKLVSRIKLFLIEKTCVANQSVTISMTTDGFEHLTHENNYWIEVKKIARKLHGLNAMLILQGSYADDTTTPFSDIDLVLIGNPRNREQLLLKNRLDEIVLAVDPLQHHGVFFYESGLLDRYSEAILPLDTFRKATAIAEPVDLNFRVLNDKYSPVATLISLVRNLKAFLIHPSEVRGMWDWKFKISQFLLIPALLAASRGRYLYKGDSFQFGAKLYSSSAWATIVELTQVRQLWCIPTPDTTDAVSTSCYHNPGRSLGRLDHDPWPVVDKLAVWRDPSFRSTAESFLNETLQLAGLT